MLISRRNLHIRDLVGKGNFCVTHKYSYSSDDDPKDVAVKTRQGSKSDSESVSHLLQTTSHLRDLQHPGIVQIVGVCISVADDPLLVNPYSQTGNLKAYVRDSNKDLKTQELLDFGQQIAEAMDYLRNQSILHGNLALRNCLLSNERKVQLSDYSLYTDVFTLDVYKKGEDKNKGPRQMVCTGNTRRGGLLYCDLVLRCVVVWCCVVGASDKGRNSVSDIDNSAIFEHVKNGNRLKKPKQCPGYNVMVRCWALEPKARPSFHQIAADIAGFSSPAGDESGAGETTPTAAKHQCRS